jgi:hypothetical protein
MEMKRLLHIGTAAALSTGLALEQEVLFRLYGTRDGLEGIKDLPGYRSEYGSQARRSCDPIPQT